MQASSICRNLTLFASSIALATFSCQALAQHSDVDRVVAFGASLTDSGNAFVWLSEPENRNCGAASSVPPYDVLDDFLVPDGPYMKGGHHFSNGATWVEGLARHLAVAGNALPALQNAGVEASNYAVGGARAVADYPCRFNLPDQVGIYLDDFSQTSPRTLVAIEIGGNDVRDALIAVATSGNPDAATPFIAGALSSLAQSIQQLYLHGARRFLVLNVPDIGKTPAVRALGPVATYVAGMISASYDVTLTGVLAGLGSLPDIDIRILDIHATLDSVVADPGSFGFLNATEACITPNQPPYKCAKPDAYVFWDGIHPTQALHAIIARQAIGVISAP